MDNIETVAEMVANSKRLIVFTGAGISTESGIQDFRSPGGLWHQWNPDELTFDKFMSSRASREHYWGFSRAIWPTMATAKPNIGHYAIADLYKMGKLYSVITQNVDGLHQAAGVPDDKVIELHGTIRWVSCLSCGKRWPREEIEKMMVDWNRIQVTNNVVFCRYDAHSCKCDNCNYRFKCGLRGE